MDAADFLAEPVVDERAFGHGVDFREIVTLGAQAVWNSQHHQRVETGDDRITRGADEQLERQPEPPGEQAEQMERPEQQQRGGTRPAAGGRLFAAVLRLRRVAFGHRLANPKPTCCANPSRIAGNFRHLDLNNLSNGNNTSSPTRHRRG
jgi:hypothetical protein